MGVPVAAALIYILFGPSSDDEKKKTKKTGSKKTTPVKAPAPAAAAPKPVPVQEKKTEEVVFHPTSSSAILTNIKTWFQVAVEDVEEEPADPLEKATAAKNRGNKYFKGGRYELAINCYTEAIEVGHHLICSVTTHVTKYNDGMMAGVSSGQTPRPRPLPPEQSRGLRSDGGD